MRVPTDLLIGGHLEAGRGPAIEVFNPAIEELLATVGGADNAQCDAAVAAARTAFKSGSWADPAERGAALGRLADLLERESEDVLRLIVAEVGTPVSTARPMQLGVPLALLRFYAEAATRDLTDDLPGRGQRARPGVQLPACSCRANGSASSSTCLARCSRASGSVTRTTRRWWSVRSSPPRTATGSSSTSGARWTRAGRCWPAAGGRTWTGGGTSVRPLSAGCRTPPGSHARRSSGRWGSRWPTTTWTRRWR